MANFYLSLSTLDLMALKEEREVLDEVEEKVRDFRTREESFKSSKTEKASSRKRAQKTGTFFFTCFQCGKSFNQHEKLKDHMGIHNGEKPFTCKRCGKSFPEKGNLNVHMRIHTGEKPYTCPDCGKSYSQRAAITSHMRIHTGENHTHALIAERVTLKEQPLQAT